MTENEAVFCQYLVPTKTNLSTAACKLGKSVTRGRGGEHKWREKKRLVQKGSRECTWK